MKKLLTVVSFLISGIFIPSAHGAVHRHVNGTAMPVAASSDAAPNTPLVQGDVFLITTDRTFYVPGDTVRISALDMGVGTEQALQIQISESLTDLNGSFVGSTSYPCDCGGSNAGWIPRGFGSGQSVNLYNKQIPPFTFGRYDFTVTFKKFVGNNDPGTEFQQTTLSVYVGSTSINGPGAVMFIDSVRKVSVSGRSNNTSSATPQPYIELSGTFPIGQPLYYLVGVMNFNDSYDDMPIVTSTNGTSVMIPALTRDSTDLTKAESRIWLMTAPQGQYGTGQSTVSPSFLF